MNKIMILSLILMTQAIFAGDCDVIVVAEEIEITEETTARDSSLALSLEAKGFKILEDKSAARFQVTPKGTCIYVLFGNCLKLTAEVKFLDMLKEKIYTYTGYFERSFFDGIVDYEEAYEMAFNDAIPASLCRTSEE